MTHLLKVTPPSFPQIPRTFDERAAREWAGNLVKELIRLFYDIDHAKMPTTGRARVTNQTLGATFTINNDGLIIYIDSASAVTSDTTTAIADGQDGEQLILVNIGANTITLKNNANTKLGADLAIATLTAYQFVWNGNDWVRVQ